MQGVARRVRAGGGNCFIFCSQVKQGQSLWKRPVKLLLRALISFEQTGDFWAVCCNVKGYVWVSGLSGNLNWQCLIKTGNAPPPLFPTRHLKPPALPPSLYSLPHSSRRVHTGALFSSLFIFSYLSFSPVQCFCLSDVVYSNVLPPPRLQASFWIQGHAVYDRNNMETDRKINHIWPHYTLSRWDFLVTNSTWDQLKWCIFQAVKVEMACEYIGILWH